MSTDPIREGYVKVKSKHLGTWNKRWLKLRAANARQPNRLEKYQDESVASNGGERTTYDLTDVRYVDRMKAKDKKHAVCIVLQSYDVVQFALNSDMEANSWLQDAQRLLFGKTDVSSMFEVYLMKSPALNNASGECLLQVTEDSVRLLDIDNPRRVQLELPLATIRRYSTERGMLRLVTGRSSPIGESELIFDTTETDAIYSGIQRATKELVARTKNKQPSTAAATATATEGGTNCYVIEQSRGADSTGSISKVRTNNSFSSTTSSVRSIDSRRPPEYEDSPPPYTAPDVPKGRSSSSRSASANKQFGQEYVESVDGEQYMEPASKSRSKSDSTYSSKSSTAAGGSSRRTGGSGRNHEQLAEETPIYNADSVSDIYDDDQEPRHQQLGYGGDRRQTGRGGGKAAGGPSSARGGSSRQAKNAGSPYDLETDYHGVGGQGVYYTSSQPPPPLPDPASVRAARGKPGSVQYSVPEKTSRPLPQQRSEATESYYDDVVGSRGHGDDEFDQERDQHWSSGNISGSFTDRVQATAGVTLPPPRMPLRRGQQSEDYEDKALNNVLAKMVADELHLRTSLKVDRYELE